MTSFRFGGVLFVHLLCNSVSSRNTLFECLGDSRPMRQKTSYRGGREMVVKYRLYNQ